MLDGWGGEAACQGCHSGWEERVYDGEGAESVGEVLDHGQYAISISYEILLVGLCYYKDKVVLLQESVR